MPERKMVVQDASSAGRICGGSCSAMTSAMRTVADLPRLAYEIEKRPFYVTRDGMGQPVEELFG